MNRVATFVITMLIATAAGAAEYMEKTPFQLSRAFSPAPRAEPLYGSPARPRRRIARAITLRTISKRRSNRCSLRLTAF